MTRAIILMLDSFGIGGAPDAAQFGDRGADTLGHIAAHNFGLNIPNMVKLGLLQAAREAAGHSPKLGIQDEAKIDLPSKFGHAKEISRAKDTSSGHWEMAGVPVLTDWGYFRREYPSFPADLVDEICKEAEIPGILGNKAASGTVIIQELGEEHIKSGKPIFSPLYRILICFQVMTPALPSGYVLTIKPKCVLRVKRHCIKCELCEKVTVFFRMSENGWFKHTEWIIRLESHIVLSDIGLSDAGWTLSYAG